MKVTSIALCRVSTVRQSAEGNSLEAQEKRVYEAADYVNAPVEKFWSLSISSRKGKNFKRRDLHEMLSYAKQYKRVQYIIVDEVDRFMRSVDEFYYWKVRFREEAGARLVYAAKPELTFKDDIYALFEEMIDVFKAETSNQERITKTTEKMQARIIAGYYPGQPKQGYQRTLQPGLHEPKEPEWSLLKSAMIEICSQAYTLNEALKRLQAKGYKTPSGRELQMDKFKTILIDSYYPGVVKKSNWPENPHGLHKPMITIEQHELLKQIVSGKKKIPHKQFNPKYRMSNILGCTECSEDVQAQSPRMVGYNHNNGKPGDKRKVYEKYRCRSCQKEHKRSEVHDEISSHLTSTQLDPKRKKEFLAALRLVWEQEHKDSSRYIKTLQARLEALATIKNSLVTSIAIGKIAEEDGDQALDSLKGEINSLNDGIEDAQGIEQDFVDFVEFTMQKVDNMQKDWWELDQKHLRWCKELLFPAGISLTRSGNVYTPTISEFYRVAVMKKSSEEPIFSELVPPRGI